MVFLQASERKLAPPRSACSTPREKLMESIKQGHAKLRLTPQNQSKSIFILLVFHFKKTH